VASYSPLSYPPTFPPTSKCKRFFLGVRWLGPDLNFLDEIKAQQAARDPSAMDCWPVSARHEAFETGRILARHLHWPTPYFIPGDRVDVILGGPEFSSIDDLGAEEAVAALEQHFGVTMGDPFWHAAASETLGQLLEGLLMARGGGP
jgi:hypothetical protein